MLYLQYQFCIFVGIRKICTLYAPTCIPFRHTCEYCIQYYYICGYFSFVKNGKLCSRYIGIRSHDINSYRAVKNFTLQWHVTHYRKVLMKGTLRREVRKVLNEIEGTSRIFERF